MPKTKNEPMTVSQWNAFNRKRKALRKGNKAKRVAYNKRPFFLYALELSDGCYYVGISRNVDKRFTSHSKGIGSQWTKLHPPVRIIEQRPTGTWREGVAARMEDLMTLEYAEVYGTNNVRGGGYCQQSPHWPI